MFNVKSFDYDLVVIGSTQEGIYAAKKAVFLQARVALVTQTDEEYLNLNSWVFSRCLHELTNFKINIERKAGTFRSLDINLPEITLKEIKNYGNLVKENIKAENSLADLAILGVDVIYGKGEFCRLPEQAFLVNNRRLRSRNYLLATGAKYQLTPKYRAIQFGCMTPDDLWQKDLNDLPKSLVIIGDSHRSLELAQGLARLGKQVTLIISNALILPGESIAANRLLQAQLIADGIEFIFNANVKDIKLVDSKIRLQIDNRDLETETVIITIRQLNINGLNLEGVGVKGFLNGIATNEKLQTTNKSIYACGDLLGRHSLPQIAEYEVDIALKNMFSFPWFKRNYDYLPLVVLTQPNFARVGLSDLKSITNKKKILIIKKNFKSNNRAQFSGVTTGFCELIIKDNGEILGCTIISDRAVELINIIAMMMRHKIKLNPNPIKGLLKQEIPYVASSYSEILNQIAIAFQEQKIRQNPNLKNRLETWFDWRR